MAASVEKISTFANSVDVLGDGAWAPVLQSVLFPGKSPSVLLAGCCHPNVGFPICSTITEQSGQLMELAEIACRPAFYAVLDKIESQAS